LLRHPTIALLRLVMPLAALDRAMATMAKDGTLAALFRRYYYDAYHVPLESVQIK
jgi:polar amino acid transport system substrate-binding protein